MGVAALCGYAGFLKGFKNPATGCAIAHGVTPGSCNEKPAALMPGGGGFVVIGCFFPAV